MIGSKVYYEKLTNSSFDWARENLLTEDHGTVLISGQIKNARGRNGRAWKADLGQLILTIILKPKKVENLDKLNMALATALATGLEEFGVGLKWPNDFYLKNKKVGGMLMEGVWNPELSGIIFGVGINVNNVISKDDPLFNIATSLKTEYGKDFNLDELFKNLISCINIFYDKWLSGDEKEIFNLWKNKQIFLGKQIKVHKLNGDCISDIAMDVHENGDLVLRSGEVVKFEAVDNIQPG